MTAPSTERVKAAIEAALATDAPDWCVKHCGALLRCERRGLPGVGVVRVLGIDAMWRAEPALILLGRAELEAAEQHVRLVSDCLEVVDRVLAELEAACPGCGGSGLGPDRVDGPGETYQDDCVECEGTGVRDGKRPAPVDDTFDDDVPW